MKTDLEAEQPSWRTLLKSIRRDKETEIGNKILRLFVNGTNIQMMGSQEGEIKLKGKEIF